MEDQWIADRSMLRHLITLHPTWSNAELARCLKRSVSWVKRWRKRFRQADPNDSSVVLGHSRARHTPPPAMEEIVVQAILDIRDHPPENLQRVPGPRAILYYLPRHASLQGYPKPLPRSTRTIWQILRQHQRILTSSKHPSEPMERVGPLEEVQCDFKVVSTVPANPGGESKKYVEVFNFVDAGTSVHLHAQARADFHAQTALEAVIEFLIRSGRPAMLTMDHDPRFVGSHTGRDFPSALLRFLLTLGIRPNICPPHRPDKNAFVERYHKTLKYECLLIQCPSTLQEVQEVIERFQTHYNFERPHQGISCQNQPPRVAFPTLPTLPPLPERVQPDAWLQSIDGQTMLRRVGSDGCVDVDLRTYFISRELSKQQVRLVVNAPLRCFEVWQATQFIKQLPIKGLYGPGEVSFQQYVQMMTQQALSEERQVQIKEHGMRQLDLWN